MLFWFWIAFFTKQKYFLCKIFVIFSNSGAWWQNLQLVHNFLEFFWFSDTTHCWPWVCVNIEMGNLEAKTPCVARVHRLKSCLHSYGQGHSCSLELRILRIAQWNILVLIYTKVNLKSNSYNVYACYFTHSG